MQYSIVNSLQNNNIKHILQVISNNNYRNKYNQTILEGIHLVKSWFDNKIMPEYCIVSENILNEVEIVNEYNNKYQYHIFQNLLSINPRKIIIVNKNIWIKLTNLPLDDMLWIINTNNLIQNINNLDISKSGIILDNIQDSGNMGNIIRTAAASNYKWVLAIGGAGVCSPKVLRAGMGGHTCLDIFQTNLSSLFDIQALLEKSNIMITSPHAQSNIYNINLPHPHIWVIGNEGNGIDKSWLDKKNIQKVLIPQNSNIESLNAATAAAICMYENVRRNQ